MIILYIILALVVIVLLFLGIKLLQLKTGNKRVTQEIETTSLKKLPRKSILANLSHIEPYLVIRGYASTS